MASRRDIVRMAVEHRTPPWVPWQISFTAEARQAVEMHFGTSADEAVGNHSQWLGSVECFTACGEGRVADRWGVVWNRSVDHDIGVVEGRLLPEPDLGLLQLPDPDDPAIYAGIEAAIAQRPDRFRVFAIGFSLYERAWTLRGMEELMTDMVEQPAFVDDLLGAICDWNLRVVGNALARFDLDAVYFGDDWGAQRGLQMGPKRWRRFILPHLRRMYGAVRAAGKHQFIHSCGDVDEVFDDLVAAGLSCFNPFQPEVMDVTALLPAYRGRLAFHGGISTQRTLPYGTPEAVRVETARMLALGAQGGYICSPAHALEGDVPLANILAMLDVLHAQPGWRAATLAA